MRMATDPESCDEETDINENDVFDERDPAFIDERFRVDRRKLEQMLQGIAPWIYISWNLKYTQSYIMCV